MAEIDIFTGEVVKEGAPSFGYDSEKDIRPVDPFGFINLRDAFDNHNVPTNIADEVANYNGIEDPSSMLGVPSDIFEAYRMNDAIQKSAKAASEKGVSSSKDEN